MLLPANGKPSSITQGREITALCHIGIDGIEEEEEEWLNRGEQKAVRPIITHKTL